MLLINIMYYGLCDLILNTLAATMAKINVMKRAMRILNPMPRPSSGCCPSVGSVIPGP
jgi:hypothetical protein